MLYERQMFSDINDFIEQNAYFMSKEIVDSISNGIKEGYLDFDNDALELIEYFFNCRHVHSSILSELVDDVQREAWNLGEGIYVEVRNGRIYWKNNHF